MSLTLSEQAPNFSLPGIDGAEHSLETYADAEILVLIQSCNHCPYVLAWEDRMNAIARDYADRGVKVVAVNSNDASRYPDDSFDSMVTHAAEKAYVVDYLYDESQELARALGAERTPEVFVFNNERRLVYHGAIDDSRDDREVAQNYLRDALDALLGSGTLAVTETPAVGCTVKWLE